MLSSKPCDSATCSYASVHVAKRCSASVKWLGYWVRILSNKTFTMIVTVLLNTHVRAHTYTHTHAHTHTHTHTPNHFFDFYCLRLAMINENSNIILRKQSPLDSYSDKHDFKWSFFPATCWLDYSYSCLIFCSSPESQKIFNCKK